jgi:hypothetical protein
MGEAGSRGTSAGMRRWWASKPKCKECKKRHPQNEFVSPLCSRCRTRVGKILDRFLAEGGSVSVKMYSRKITKGQYGNVSVWTVKSGMIENGSFHRDDGTVFELPNVNLILAWEGR